MSGPAQPKPSPSPAQPCVQSRGGLWGYACSFSVVSYDCCCLFCFLGIGCKVVVCSVSASTLLLWSVSTCVALIRLSFSPTTRTTSPLSCTVIKLPKRHVTVTHSFSGHVFFTYQWSESHPDFNHTSPHIHIPDIRASAYKLTSSNNAVVCARR